MGLFSKTRGQGWSFDRRSGRLTISGDMGDADDFFDEFDNIREKVRSVAALPGASIRNGGGLFKFMSSLSDVDLAELDVSKCTDMSFMFYCCHALTSLDLSTWDVANVENMGFMFAECSRLESIKTGPLWKPRKVESTEGMFVLCNKLRRIDKTEWRSASLKHCGSMFSGCESLEELDLSSMGVGNVEKLNSMFSGCTGLRTLKLGGWNTRDVVEMKELFKDCSSLQTLDLEGWRIGEDTNTKDMFDGVPQSLVVTSDDETVTRLLPAGVKTKEPKDKLTIALLGHVGHGKTTLMNAIARVLERYYGFPYSDDAAAANALTVRGLKVDSTAVRCETTARRYVLIDCADHASWVKRLVIEPNRFDGAIVVVDAVDGPQATTREQLLLASELGISSLVVFLNKCDAAEDDEMLCVTEMETRELLDDYGFDGTSTPVIRGSALTALNEPGGDVGYVGTVRSLIEAMDDAIPTPEPVNEQPFLMQVYEHSHSPKNEEVAFGWVERGTVRVGEEVEIVGISKHALRLDVTRIRALRKDVDAAKAGDNVEVWLGRVYRPVLQKGHVLACPGSIGAHSSFEAEVYALRTDEGGRQTPFYDYDLFQFNFGTDDFEGAVELSEGLEMVMPGDRARIYVGLDYPVAMERGTGFYIREGGRTVGMGTVTAYGDLEDEDDLSFYVDDEEEEEEEPLSETSDDEGGEE